MRNIAQIQNDKKFEINMWNFCFQKEKKILQEIHIIFTYKDLMCYYF